MNKELEKFEIDLIELARQMRQDAAITERTAQETSRGLISSWCKRLIEALKSLRKDHNQA
jgi:hypothetical protein